MIHDSRSGSDLQKSPRSPSGPEAEPLPRAALLASTSLPREAESVAVIAHGETNESLRSAIPCKAVWDNMIGQDRAGEDATCDVAEEATNAGDLIAIDFAMA